MLAVIIVVTVFLVNVARNARTGPQRALAKVQSGFAREGGKNSLGRPRAIHAEPEPGGSFDALGTNVQRLA